MITNRYFAFVVFAFFLVAFKSIEALPAFQSRIPNGNNVPDPCNPGQIWQAVGHTSTMRGSSATLNTFGFDFGNVGMTWSNDICRKDSDGDGRTNGEELGDPNCQWTSGSNRAAYTFGLSHPGICEPVTSQDCIMKNYWLDINSCRGNNNNNNNNNNSNNNNNNNNNYISNRNWKLIRQCVCYCDEGGNYYQGSRYSGNRRPPIGNTSEFNQPQTFAVRNTCTCACPWVQPSS